MSTLDCYRNLVRRLRARIASLEASLRLLNDNVKICVLYDVAGFAAERSFVVQQILDRYFLINGIRVYRNPVTYLAITSIPETDRRNLEALSHDGFKIFISALGSGLCLYLQNLFFNSNLDTVHVNSFSTSPSLESAPNLLRYQAPDNQVAKVYLFQVRQVPGVAKVAIVFEPGIYSGDLSQLIFNQVTGAGLAAQRFPVAEFSTTVIDQYVGSDPFSLIFVLGSPLNAIQQVANDPSLSAKTFNILTADAAAQDLTSDFLLLAFLELKQSRLIQTFTPEQQLQTAAEYETAINNPEHPVSATLSFFLAVFDWSVLVANTAPEKRLTRRTYLNLQLNENLDNANTIYGTYSYVPESLSIAGFFFIYLGTLYAGQPVPDV